MRQTTNAQSANVLPIEKRSAEVADILREHIGQYQQTCGSTVQSSDWINTFFYIPR